MDKDFIVSKVGQIEGTVRALREDLDGLREEVGVLSREIDRLLVLFMEQEQELLKTAPIPREKPKKEIKAHVPKPFARA